MIEPRLQCTCLAFVSATAFDLAPPTSSKLWRGGGGGGGAESGILRLALDDKCWLLSPSVITSFITSSRKSSRFFSQILYFFFTRQAINVWGGSPPKRITFEIAT